jgi:hypothetical protein
MDLVRPVAHGESNILDAWPSKLPHRSADHVAGAPVPLHGAKGVCLLRVRQVSLHLGNDGPVGRERLVPRVARGMYRRALQIEVAGSHVAGTAHNGAKQAGLRT